MDAGPRAVALAEGDARGNTLDRDEARSAADPGMVLQRPALRAPLHRGGSQATRLAISRAVLTSIRDKAAAFDLVRRLLALGEIDWHADRPLENPAALDAMLAIS